MAKRVTPAETLRHAVDQTFQTATGSAQTTRDRAADLADDLAQTAGRLRGALEELRPPSADDVRRLHREFSALERRVAALEQKSAPATGSRRAATTRRASGARSGRAPRASSKP